MGFGEAVRGRAPLADVCAMAEELLFIAGSATAREVNGGETPWNRIDYIAAHLWSTQTGKPYPALPKTNAKNTMRDPQRQAAINAAKDRAAERRRLIEAGEIT